MSSLAHDLIPAPPPAAGRAARTGGFAAREIVVFDVLSHGSMHLQFNEAYLRLVHAAFPAHTILFFARPAHLDGISGRIADLDRLELRSCAPFTVPFGLSHHSPVAGRWAAVKAIQDIQRSLIGTSPDLVSVLGVDANLYARFSQSWPRMTDAPLHLILHSQLGDSMLWRSRNPLLRMFDFVSAIDRPLPPNIRLVALELGVKEAIAEVTRKPGPGIVTLEHPVLYSEWPPETARRADDDALRIGFLGHSSRTKGFHLFAEMAAKYRQPDRRFEAIGMWAPETETLDLSGLDRLPAQGGLPRADYLEALAGVDVVCLPLSSRAYDFIASGSVSDAIAGLKPLLALRTRTLAAIWDRHGPIGHLAESECELADYISNMSRGGFLRDQKIWSDNLRKLRHARLPKSLAQHYRGLVDGSPKC